MAELEVVARSLGHPIVVAADRIWLRLCSTEWTMIERPPSLVTAAWVWTPGDGWMRTA